MLDSTRFSARPTRPTSLQLAAGLDLNLADLARKAGCSVEELRSVNERLGMTLASLSSPVSATAT